MAKKVLFLSSTRSEILIPYEVVEIEPLPVPEGNPYLHESWRDEFGVTPVSKPKTALLIDILMRKGKIDFRNLPEDSVVFKGVCDE